MYGCVLTFIFLVGVISLEYVHLLRVNSIRRYTTEIIANRTDNYYYFWVGLLRNLMEIPIYVANEFLGNCQNGFKRDTSVDFGCFLLEE